MSWLRLPGDQLRLQAFLKANVVGSAGCLHSQGELLAANTSLGVVSSGPQPKHGWVGGPTLTARLTLPPDPPTNTHHVHSSHTALPIPSPVESFMPVPFCVPYA